MARRFPILLITILSCAVVGCGDAEPVVRVLILAPHAPRRITLSVAEPGWELAGRPLAVGQAAVCELVAGGLSVDGTRESAGMVRLEPPQPAASFSLAWGESARRYPGALEITAVDASLVLVNRVPLEAYVAAVLAAEALPPRPSPEGEAAFLQALAVVVRNYALYYRGRHGRHHEAGADLCDQTHCQAYRGSLDGPAHRRAAAATAAVVLHHEGHLVPGYHSSTCAGRTALPQEAWGGSGVAGYRNVDDRDGDGRPFCAASPHLVWRFALPAVALVALVEQSCFPLGNLAALEFEYGADGRVRYVRSGDREVSGEAFRNAVCRVHGWGSLRSLAFRMGREQDAAVFSGHGLGHAVGLCQYGARAYAEQAPDWRRVLRHYFPGLSLGRE